MDSSRRAVDRPPVRSSRHQCSLWFIVKQKIERRVYNGVKSRVFYQSGG